MERVFTDKATVKREKAFGKKVKELSGAMNDTC
jgi:hypothetical protein